MYQYIFSNFRSFSTISTKNLEIHRSSKWLSSTYSQFCPVWTWRMLNRISWWASSPSIAGISKRGWNWHVLVCFRFSEPVRVRGPTWRRTRRQVLSTWWIPFRFGIPARETLQELLLREWLRSFGELLCPESDSVAAAEFFPKGRTRTSVSCFDGIRGSLGECDGHGAIGSGKVRLVALTVKYFQIIASYRECRVDRSDSWMIWLKHWRLALQYFKIEGFMIKTTLTGFTFFKNTVQ